MKNDHRSKFSNLSNWKEEAWKNQGFNGSRTRDFRHTPPVWCSTSRAMKPHIGSEIFRFFQASSFQLLKLENLLRWSFFTLIYNRSSNIRVVSYLLHIISLLTGEWTQQIDLAPNVWLHGSVDGASHRYRGGHGFESRWSLDFFRLLLSNCLNWKI